MILKKRVSLPAPRDTICFGWSGLIAKKRSTSSSMAVVRM